MNTRFALLVSGFFLLSITSNAQIEPEALGYYTDALKFSQTTSGGTARFQGIGGVNVALGADLSSLAGNPAGMGFYQRSEIGISTALGFAGTRSTFLTNTKNDNRDYLNFPNLGMVFATRKDETEEGAFRGGAFGIGLTRINNFQNQFSYSDTNSTNSIADYFVDLANGTPAQDLDEEFDNITSLAALGYFAYFIDFNKDTTNLYYSYYPGTRPFKQEEIVLTRGAINQWNFSYGGNFNDKVYVGASLGVPMLRYLIDKNYKETYQLNDSIESLKFSESLKVKGTGINLKLGLILKPMDWIRVGLTLQTPTFYSLKEEYGYSAKSVYKGDLLYQSSDEKTVPGEYKYNLITPFKASAGIALFAGKSGFIAADIEYVPHSRTRLRESSTYGTSDNSTFVADNTTIQNLYRSVLNLTIGGELRHDIFRFRAGYALQGDAYTNVDDVDRKVVSISGGAGVRLESYYLDIALVNSRYNSVYRSYAFKNGQGSPEAKVKNSNTSFVISAGLFF